MRPTIYFFQTVESFSSRDRNAAELLPPPTPVAGKLECVKNQMVPSTEEEYRERLKASKPAFPIRQPLQEESKSSASSTPCLLEHFISHTEGFFSNFSAAYQLCDFLCFFFRSRRLSDHCISGVLFNLFFYHIMAVGKCCNLWKMGHTQSLLLLPEILIF